jgi:two-component system LytT family response regulator
MALLVYAAIAVVGHLASSDVKAAYPERITVREWSRAHLVRAADVEWIESDDNYVIVRIAGRVIKGRGRISDLESRLDPARFVRIHRSAIVARDRVREVRPLAKGDVAVVMTDGKMLRVARTRRVALERVLGS